MKTGIRRSTDHAVICSAVCFRSHAAPSGPNLPY